MKDHSKEFPLRKQFKILDVNRSAYYDWLKGKTYQKSVEAQGREQRILEVFRWHKRRYGARRIVKALIKEDVKTSRSEVRKVLSRYGYKAIQPRSFVPKTTNSKHHYPINQNLLLELPAASSPNAIWVGDITYIPLVNGQWAYLSEWMDLFSRMIVGWRLKEHMKEELVMESFKIAENKRRPPTGLVVHSDRGGQYGGNGFRKLLRDKYNQSMSRADNPYDNAFMESCFSRLKTELLEGGVFQNIEDARTEIFDYIETYYNRVRLHSSLGYKSPAEFELNYYEKNK